MKLNAVGVCSSDLKVTAKFYELLGFNFPKFSPEEQHLEPIPDSGSIRLMIDSASLIESIIGQKPFAPNHSSFAIEYNSPSEVDEIVQKVKENGFKIFKEPWDAFWGQRYAIVEDPDGYKVDLYSNLNKN